MQRFHLDMAVVFIVMFKPKKFCYHVPCGESPVHSMGFCAISPILVLPTELMSLRLGEGLQGERVCKGATEPSGFTDF